MALIRCPECRQKISEHAENCLHCGFSLKQEDLAIYKQQLEERRLHNAEINRKSTKLHLIWFCIFALFIIIASLITQS
ncbi:hypothetical protein [Rodentibacter sp. Ppn85]|uniref:hypothetical protein n=1 Tax=Rodentibacter sp. Ppn85 TaxID=1908525 RepID=UPI0009867086|nr:hypothetical protein [Rodentibacter sp. Ppn85]OOF65499.1 hypothetical protein BKL51_05400 [Rodentibacter sp. Ppn85]